jgi:hypothetical protein
MLDEFCVAVLPRQAAVIRRKAEVRGQTSEVMRGVMLLRYFVDGAPILPQKNPDGKHPNEPMPR